jgi:dTDP-4-dehydrorhamnose 3,5-epimerase
MPSTGAEIPGVEVRSLKLRADARGWLAELFRADELPAELLPAMGYLSVTLPGQARGPHEHGQQTDLFCFPGPGEIDLYLWDARPSPSPPRPWILRVGASNRVMVLVPPGVVHGYRAVGLEPALVLNFANRLYGGAGRAEPVDEIRHEDRPGSPYHIGDAAVEGAA